MITTDPHPLAEGRPHRTRADQGWCHSSCEWCEHVGHAIVAEQIDAELRRVRAICFKVRDQLIARKDRASWDAAFDLNYACGEVEAPRPCPQCNGNRVIQTAYGNAPCAACCKSNSKGSHGIADVCVLCGLWDRVLRAGACTLCYSRVQKEESA